jgi:hypothetical protein
LSKKNLFSLEDNEEELTHLGTSIGELDDFNEPLEDDDDG